LSRPSRAALVGVLLVLLAAANLRLPDWHDRLFRPPLEGRTQVDIVLDLLGELRTFAAQMLYVRGDLYHHVMEAQGFSWTQTPDILPIYHLSTILDPHLVGAYDVASYDLVMNFDRHKEGLAFLDEGLHHNPESVQLLLAKAFLLYHVGDYEQVVPSAGRALQLAQEQVDRVNAVRMLAHALEKLGQKQDEIHALRLWLTIFPGDHYPTRRMRELGQEPVGFSEEDLLRMQAPAPPQP